MSKARALEIAIRRLQKARTPSMRGAAAILVDLRAELLTHEDSSPARKITLLNTKRSNAA